MTTAFQPDAVQGDAFDAWSWPPPAGWSDLGQDPVIAAETTATARTVMALCPYLGRVYLGYGDWTANTGPCDLRRFDPATGGFDALVAGVATDAIHNIRVLDGTLYAIGFDPEAGTDPDYVAYDGTTATTVSNYPTVDGAHLFDMTLFSEDGRLYLGGQSYNGGASSPVSAAGHDAAVWWSANGGATWARVIVDTTFGRAVGLLDVGGYLWCQPVSWSTGLPRSTAYRSSDGATWSSTSVDLLPNNGLVWRPWRIGGVAAYLSRNAYWSGGASVVRLLSFDGTTVTEHAGIGAVWDHFFDGTTLYVLTQAGAVLATTDLATFDVLTDEAPTTGRSICAVDGVVFVGTADSRLWALA